MSKKKIYKVLFSASLAFLFVFILNIASVFYSPTKEIQVNVGGDTGVNVLMKQRNTGFPLVVIEEVRENPQVSPYKVDVKFKNFITNQIFYMMVSVPLGLLVASRIGGKK